MPIVNANTLNDVLNEYGLMVIRNDHYHKIGDIVLFKNSLIPYSCDFCGKIKYFAWHYINNIKQKHFCSKHCQLSCINPARDIEGSAKKSANSRRGSKRTKEQRQRMSVAQIKRFEDPKERMKAGLITKGKKQKRETVERRAAANTGKKRTIEQKLHMSESAIRSRYEHPEKLLWGNKSPLWTGGKYTKIEHKYIKQFEKIRKIIIVRDKNKCVLCKKHITKFGTTKVNVHHIDSDKANNDIYNLVTLCVVCHSRITHCKIEMRNKYKTKLEEIIRKRKITKKQKEKIDFIFKVYS